MAHAHSSGLANQGRHAVYPLVPRLRRPGSASGSGDARPPGLLSLPERVPALEETIAARFGVDVEVPVRTDDISLLRFLANSGRGLAVVPQTGVREDLIAGRVERILLHDVQPIDIDAMYLTNGVRRQLVDEFLS